MIRRLFRRRYNNDIPAEIYGTIVAQARNPVLYRDLHIADTVDGRLESIILHLTLVMRRMAVGGELPRAAGQAVFDLFCTQMDQSLREMGIGDLSVPKRMREIGEVYYGRAQTYNGALNEEDHAGLKEVLERSVPAVENGNLASDALATYMELTNSELSKLSDEDVLAGKLVFADPRELA